ncbi:hypothetical protein [Rugamonas fusca]|uniref:hypothetical protein n=1 Tax=Rugamonas fusca TaxID=2758568 RepID=UPI001E5DCBA6|nr:hypothetical protein [Rugamonas fusca]
MMPSRSAGRAALACLILLASCAALAAPKVARRPAATLPRYGMLVFSDLCLHPDSGEFGGQRITLQRFAEVDTVIYEYTAGGLSWPVVASDVNIDPRGRQLYFVVTPPGEDERTISGKLSDDGNTLLLDGAYCDDGSVPMRLHRVTDFGRKPGACHACPAPRKPAAADGEPGQPPVDGHGDDDAPMLKNEGGQPPAPQRRDDKGAPPRQPAAEPLPGTQA